MSTEKAPPRFPLIPITYSPDWDFSDHAATFGIEMTLIHNVFIRCLNSIHEHAVSIPASSSDVIPFAGYALAWVKIIHDHHHGEEEIIFPFLQTKFPADMQKNLDEHKVSLEGLGRLEEYLKGVYEKKDVEWDGEKVRTLIEAFGDGLVEHLHEEIPTLSPERLSQFDKAELDKMVEVHATQHIKAQPLTTAHVLVVTNHDFETYPSWPPMPAPVKWIIRNVAFWRHHSFWKFAPFTRYSKPQTYVAPSQ